MVLKPPQTEKPLRDLLDMIHFIENTCAKIHGLFGEAEIYKALKEEFAKSQKYNISILLLTDDGTGLRLEMTSLPLRQLNVAARATGFPSYKSYVLDPDRSSFSRQVAREGKTIEARFIDVLRELFPGPLPYLISKTIGYEKRSGILTPLYRREKITGVLVVDSTELPEYLIPSVRTLSQHISTALELAEEHAKRKQAEETIGESEERYRNLVELAPDGIVTLNMKGVITSVNKTATRLSGYSENEFVGKHFSKMGFLQARDIPRYLKLFSSIVRGKIPEPIEFPYYNKDGNLRWVESHICFLEAGGKKVGILAILRDITERKRMEDELRRYSEHLEDLVEEKTRKLREVERMAVIGETAAMVGHDLRNPLQVVCNLLYLGKRMLEEIPSQYREISEKKGIRQLFQTVAEQIEYMDKIVSDLQDYARPLNPVLEEIDPQRLVSEALSTLTIPGNVEVTVTIPQDFAKLMVDQNLMKRVFTNLIRNALEAMPKGGRLVVDAIPANESALIRVRDTGVGIAKENIPNIFHPLFTTKARGQGLGLSVCKRLVEAHGGSITVESKVGEGSTFVVRIPIRSEAG